MLFPKVRVRCVFVCVTRAMTRYGLCCVVAAAAERVAVEVYSKPRIPPLPPLVGATRPDRGERTVI